jgi:peptidoglycan hydrolase-like protein with peptidoglycan-binding domain
MSLDDVRRALKTPTPTALDLPAPSRQILKPAQIAVLARKGLIRIGWFYRSGSGAWRESVADGYALTSDGAAATCYHCVEPPRGMRIREGYLFAASSDFRIFAVDAVLAADAELDAAIVRIAGGDFVPIALNDQVAPGDPVYLLSDPGEMSGFFSSGQINRFYWMRPGTNDRDTLEGVRNLRINVSTDWAPGSSGAAVLDTCGNAIGHVSTINTLGRPAGVAPDFGPATTEASTRPNRFQGANQPPATYVVLHEAVPALGVRLLAESMSGAAGAVTKP